MKFLIVFAAILAVALGGRSNWNLYQLSEALESPHTNPSLVPILEQALNAYMTAMFAGENHQSISITTAPVDLSTWTLSELSEAVENPNTNPAILPHLENALNSLMSAIFAGEAQPTTAQVAVVIPALEISYWTLADLDQALSNPATNPALIPYLEQSLNHIMENLFSGVQQTFIVLATPLGLTAVTPEAVVAPEVVIDPVQVVEEALDAPVQPVVVANPTVVSGSPLVQIILNIKQQSAAPEVVAPAPVVLPDNTEAYPNPRPPAPVNPRPPAPVIVPPTPLPTPEVQPEPVIVVPDYNPIDVIAINPETLNPIEAVAISPPEVNPVDLLNPVIVPGVVIGGDIGPM